jgi:chorismate mutase / prephenate dehydratase
VGQLKESAGEAPTLAPGREASLLSNLERESDGPLRADHLRAIYREILSASRSLQKPMRIAYLGPAATFGHQAAIARFGHAPEYVPAASISDVFVEVQRGGADYGVVPVENSTEGAVHETLDQLVDTELKICSEVIIPVVQNLMALDGIDAIKTVCSKDNALAQCRGWLSRNLPGRNTMAVVSTARAAEMAAKDPSIAAIGTALAAEVYGLQILDSGIQDVSSNWTRHLIIGTSPSEAPTGRDRTFLVFSIKDRVGVLRDVMDAFSDFELNLASIQSRPSRRRAWDYVFFVEIDGHAAEERVQKALARAEPNTVFMKVLGAWPRT